MAPRMGLQQQGVLEADRRWPYLPGLDGLRALAVAAVLLYHADVPWMPGGFLGVDLFFVLSGYLITALLLAEWRRADRIDLRAFWHRRATRLLPAALALIVVVPAGMLVALPDETARLPGDVLASLTGFINWRLILRQESYFEAFGRPSPLQHLWSLAVEAQFYLLWPLLLALALRRRGPRAALLAAVLGAALATAAMALLFQPGEDPSRVYYGTDTRAAAPLVGAALACLWRPSSRDQRRRAARLVDALGLMGLGIFGVCVVGANEFVPALYQGGFFGVALVAAAAVAAATTATSWTSRALSWPPMVWLGRRSYSIYLWHWPVAVFTRPQLDVSFEGVPLLLLRIMVTLALAEVSYRWIEHALHGRMPDKTWRSATSWITRSRWASVTGILIACASAVVLVELAQARQAVQPMPEQLATDIAAIPEDAAGQPEPIDAPPVTFRQSAANGGAATRSPADAGAADSVARSSADVSRQLAQRDVRRLMAKVASGPSLPEATAAVSTTATDPVIAHKPQHILALGDSVMLGAARDLTRVFGEIEVDAKQSRQIKAFIAIVRQRRAAGRLGDVVIVHLGTNGPITPQLFDALMDELRDVQRVVVVNDNVPRRWEQLNNRILQDGAARYGNAVLADWKGAIDGHPGLLARDGVHLGRSAARIYASLIADAVGMP